MKALRYAVLGLLIDRPSYPYELSRLFTERVGPAWQLNHSAVSQTIARLYSEGLIERLKQRPTAGGGVDSWLWGITECGKQVYDAWISGNKDKGRPLRDELFVKIAFCRPEDIGHVCKAIRRRVRIDEERLDEYRKRRALLQSDNSSTRLVQLMPSRLMEFAIGQIENEIDDLEDIFKDLKRFQETSAGSEAANEG